MPTIKTIIDVGQSAEMVWRVLTEFELYPKWNPYVVSVLGTPKLGQRLKVQTRIPGGAQEKFKVRVIKSIPATELRWRRSRLLEGIFDRELAFIIIPNGIKGVRFILRERFTGFMAPFMMMFLNKKTTKAFNIMNMALKRTAEAKTDGQT